MTTDARKHDPIFRQAQHLKDHPNDSRAQKPREICPACNEEVYLRWGEIRTTPHWCHYAAKGVGCNWNGGGEGAGETDEHKQAKQILLAALTGPGLVFSTRCVACDRVTDDRMPSLTYSAEVASDANGHRCRWDVAGVDETGSIRIGIEVCHSHQTRDSTARSRSGVWWAEVTSGAVLGCAGVWNKEAPLCVQNARQRQVCMDGEECAWTVAAEVLAEEERIANLEKTAIALGHIVDGDYTCIVDMSGPYRETIKAIQDCLCCGEQKDPEKLYFAFCWGCKHDVSHKDKRTLSRMARTAGILSLDSRIDKATGELANEGKWTINAGFAPSSDKEAWERLRQSTTCAKCLTTTRSRGGYARFPLCGDCFPTITAPRGGAKRQIEDVSTPAVGTGHLSATEEEMNAIISGFDGNTEFGPRLGITRMQRWERAEKLGCAPPVVVKAILLDDLKTNNTPKYQDPYSEANRKKQASATK